MKNTINTLIILFTLISFQTIALPKLSSYPNADAVVFIDFDGQTVSGTLWNGGQRFVCAAPSLSDNQITQIFNLVAEDFRPFMINVTTDSSKFFLAPVDKRIRMIVTPTSSWKNGVAGVSYVGSFTWGDDTPGFIFSDRLGNTNVKYIAECTSHEVGHTMGLLHQSRYDNSCNLQETYNSGAGTGETGWAPIMGNSYNRSMTGWSNGATPNGCANTQDNLEILTNANGFTYRSDDYLDQMNSNSFTVNAASFNLTGVIATNTDKDVFRFALTGQTSLHLESLPYTVGVANTGSNLDIIIRLYNETGNLLRTYDPLYSVSVTIDTTLPAGNYYFEVAGCGNTNTTNYGSLGSYRLTGFSSTLALRSVTLSGSVTTNGNHKLNWTVDSDEPVINEEVEVSENGSDFAPLSFNNILGKQAEVSPRSTQFQYYRVKVGTTTGESVYSNVIALRSSSVAGDAFTFATLVQSDLQLIANQNFEFRLFDMNGRMVQSGKGQNGVNRLDLSRLASGVFVIDIRGQKTQLTKRIVKQ